MPHLITKLPGDADAGLPEAAGEGGRTPFNPSEPWEEESGQAFETMSKAAGRRQAAFNRGEPLTAGFHYRCLFPRVENTHADETVEEDLWWRKNLEGRGDQAFYRAEGIPDEFP